MTAPHSAVGPWLIGGPGRTGKTTLTVALGAAPGPVAGFPLEGVFHVYLKRRFPFFRHQLGRLLHEYLTRPRYIDGDRSAVERPIDHFDADVTALLAEVPGAVDHQIRLFAWLLDRYAAAHGRATWAVFDLLPELRYPTYRRLIPGVRLAVVERAPEEAIAAALFWRSYPASPAGRWRRFQTLLFQWCLSRAATAAMAARFGDDVATVSFNALVAGDADECARVARLFASDAAAIRDAFDFEPSFAYQRGRGFRGPDGNWQALLSEREHAEIARAVAGTTRRADLRTLLSLAPHAPVLARGLGDFLLYPRSNLVRRANALRQRASDATAGLRLSLGTGG